MSARRDYITALLNAARPTTVYDEPTFIDTADIPKKIVAWDLLNRGSVDRALLDAARRDARSVEGQSAKSANKAIREWLRGNGPLDWALLGPLPATIDGKRKCRLDSITADLLEDAADYIEAQGRKVYANVLLLVDALRLLAREARRRGLPIVSALGDGLDVDRSRWSADPLGASGDDDPDEDDDEP